WKSFDEKNRQARVDMLKITDPTRVATDVISGLSVELYNADAAMAAFIHSIDVYLGKIKVANNARLRVTPIGNVTVPRFQHGYNGMITQPTLFLAGEAGPEHVKVTPQSGKAVQGGNAGGVTVNFNG